ncbi:MAG TPA: IPT/TIG domain-containing protein [Bryobacteraceae bacterium]|nr:IPT/TIG domain-containing protein [Bryobacteraceae bacterium]
MTRFVRSAALVAVLFSTTAIDGFSQALSNASMTGKYFVRHVEFTTDASNNATDARSIVGTITFDGNGNYTVAGQQVIGTGAAASFSVSGTYSVTPAGLVTLTNPQNSALSINGRYGTEAVIGASTNAPTNVFDLFVAIPAPAASTTDSTQTLNATYHMVDFELPGGATAQVRTSGMSAQFNGSGSIATFLPLGHLASVGSGAAQTSQQFTGTYTVNSDGTGTVAFSPVGGTSTTSTALLAGGNRNLYVSASGNMILGGTPGAHDILIGVKPAASATSLSGRYWLAGLEVDSTGTTQDYVGSGSTVTSASTLFLTELNHSVPAVAPGAPNLFTQTSTQGYAATTNGFGGTCNCGIGTGNVVAAGHTYVLIGNNGTFVAMAPGVDGSGNAGGASNFSILVGEQIPTLTGTGVFINPQGIVNSATYAPVGDNIAPGEFITIFGSGLAAASTSATALPFPTSLGNVSVSIGGTPAPIYHVEATQIICIVPYEIPFQLASTTTTIVVTNNNTPSNTVNVGVVAAAPGVFSANDQGYGDGAITHVNNTLVNSASPATAGETVQMYVSGLGPLTTAVADGNGFTGIDNATIEPIVLIAGNAVPVTYWGLTEDAGLYQINFVVPTGTPSGEQMVAVASTNGVTGEVSSTITIAVK